MVKIDIYNRDMYHRGNKCHFYLILREEELMNKKLFGKAGEKMAANYLISRGHRILEQGYRSKTGEIDIISIEGERVHFIEVKTRSSIKYGMPKEAVTADKLRHIKNTAEVYIKALKGHHANCECCMPDFSYSIDVIEILVNHIEGVE